MGLVVERGSLTDRHMHAKSTAGALPVKQRQNEAKTHFAFCIIIKADSFPTVSK